MRIQGLGCGGCQKRRILFFFWLNVGGSVEKQVFGRCGRGESLETHRPALSSNCDHKSFTGKLYGDVINICGAAHIFQMIEAAFVGELGTGPQSG